MALDDLPEHRREALLWRHALELDYDGVDDLVRDNAGGHCRLPLREDRSTAEWVAALGEDGRYHLLIDGRPSCTASEDIRDPNGAIPHEHWCHWWWNADTYRTQAPPGAWGPDGLLYGATDSCTVQWLVRLTDTTTDPVLVPVRRRCVHHTSRTQWPGYQGSDTPEGRQRAKLVAALGRNCHACGTEPGAAIDHDHFTGMVRGLLCRYCNTHIDNCPHADGCQWADYLNNPPAASMRLRYTKSDRAGRSDRAAEKIAYLGFDPIYRGPATQLRRFPPRQLPPPPPAASIDASAVERPTLF